MNALIFLESKLNNFIDFLDNTKAVAKNKESKAKLPSFRDVPWSIAFCREITPSWLKNKDQTLNNLILETGCQPKDFSKEELSKIHDYVDCFIQVVSKIPL